MLSRAAEAVYWMSRYVERAENVARFVDVNLHLALDLPEGSVEQWAPLVATTGDDAWFREHYGEPTRESVMRFLTFDRRYGSSILSCLRAARENARGVREIISSEMWAAINEAYLFVTDAASRPEELASSPHAFYSAIKVWSHRFVGVTHVTMTHNEAWHFVRLGRLLERADKTSRIVDVKYFLLLPRAADVGSPYDEIQWAALLKSASALEMYRKLYRKISPSRVIEFLLLDREFPRSARYCVSGVEHSLRQITGAREGGSENPTEALIGRLRAEFEQHDVEAIIEGGLHQHLDDLQSRLNELGSSIHETFFH